MEQGRAWFHQKVEVIGAVDEVGDPRDSRCPCYAFRVWSVELLGGSEGRRPGANLPSSNPLDTNYLHRNIGAVDNVLVVGPGVRRDREEET